MCMALVGMQECLAFSTPHAVLQEVVGIAVVPLPGPSPPTHSQPNTGKQTRTRSAVSTYDR